MLRIEKADLPSDLLQNYLAAGKVVLPAWVYRKYEDIKM